MQKEFDQLHSKMIQLIADNPEKENELKPLLFSILLSYNRFAKISGSEITHRVQI